ncbi:(+)-neomenthol dehydrogenase [Zea mays]|uniref:(+)-neomenthol dehydrogenase n=1 Tax=Zea mays TaxID=4577 RepID=A0A1D6JAW1_MAIZE|nr:(+)-neomenthol dehydrogenase [Zea mays]
MEAAAIPTSAPETRIAVVTGGNKGIGLEVCRQLAGAGATVVVLTARDETRGAAAAQELRESGLSDVIFHQLDITDAASVSRLAEFLKARFGKLDILVNNAAVGAVEYVQDPADSSTSEEELSGMDMVQRLQCMLKRVRETYDAATEGIKTNYYGIKHVIEALLPLLQASSDGRIVNVSSDFGLLRVTTNQKLRQELNDVEKLTEERLDEVLAAYLRDFDAGEVGARGWPVDFSAYKVAKVAMNAYTRILARSHPGLRVNCAHPGYVSTDMTVHTGPLTPEQGAANVVKVALLPEGGPTGAYFALGEEASFM